MRGLGDHQRHVGVGEVAGQVRTLTGVVDTHDGAAGQACAGQGEEVVGRVVEQHPHVRGRAGGQSLDEQVRPPAGLGHELAMGPDA